MAASPGGRSREAVAAEAWRPWRKRARDSAAFAADGALRPFRASARAQWPRALRRDHPEIWHFRFRHHPKPPRPGEVDGREYRFVDERGVRPPRRHRRACSSGPSSPGNTLARRASPSGSAPPPDCLHCWRSTSPAPGRCGGRCPTPLLVFLAPPAWEELVRRLTGRGTEPRRGHRAPPGRGPEELAAQGRVRRHTGEHVRRASLRPDGNRLIAAAHDSDRKATRWHATPAADGIINPPIDELLQVVGQQVRAGDHGGQARPPDQRLLLPARRGPARVRRPAGRDPRAGEAAVDRAARDQRAAC